jgi:hypothetical protein|nr:MAG TPA: Protein of unknown function (DUF2829) [Caudoviricetes sp.]
MELEFAKYIGTKLIKAKPMTRGEYNAYRGWTLPKNENPDDDGYLIVYVDSDDYVSWSPKDVFDRAYRSCDGGMTFGGAIELLKMGFKVARKGWNGKGMFIYLQDGSYPYFHQLKEDVQRKLIDSNCTNDSGAVTICPHIDMKAADGSIVIGWLASQTDMLADDWVVVR